MPQLVENEIKTSNTTNHISKPRALDSSAVDANVDLASVARPNLYSTQILRIALVVLFADVLAWVASLAVVVGPVWAISPASGLMFLAPIVLGSNLLFMVHAGLYPGLGMNPADELKKITSAIFLAILSTVLIGVCFLSLSLPAIAALVLIGSFEWMLVCALRGMARSYLVRVGWSIPYFILGERDATLTAFKQMHLFGKSLLRPAGRFVYSHEESMPVSSENSLYVTEQDELKFEREAIYLGTVEDLKAESVRRGVHWLFVVESSTYATPTTKQLSSLFPQVVVVHANQFASHREKVFCQGGIGGARFQDALKSPAAALMKRLVDLVVSGAALLVFSPLFLVVATLIKLSSKGPIFFGHTRMGRGGSTFKAWKFRSMVPNAQQVLHDYLQAHPELRDEWERDHKLKNDPRITWIGRLLRKTSLDELPQLWNVFVGEMSLVGPRPIVKEEIGKYAETYEEYKRVLPGITGLWQISGRNNTTYEERLFFDRFYVSNWSVWLDLFILVRTVKTVLFCEGAY
jgi:Undecaprenyl-phosphate galactose phosphotransferase WbaP